MFLITETSFRYDLYVVYPTLCLQNGGLQAADGKAEQAHPFINP